jgi:hypothetical protein
VKFCCRCLVTLAKQNNVTLVWVSGRKGMPGSESTNNMAKEMTVPFDQNLFVESQGVWCALRWLGEVHVEFWMAHVDLRHRKGMTEPCNSSGG